MEWLRTKVAELEDAITHHSTMRKLGAELRAVFYNTEEELKRSERVKYTGIRDSVGTLGYPWVPENSTVIKAGVGKIQRWDMGRHSEQGGSRQSFI